MPNHRPAEPIAPATVPDSEHRQDGAQFGSVPGAERKIPDRSAEPAVKESLDPEKSRTAANSSDVPPDAPADARDDEGNVVKVEANREEAPEHARPDSDAGSQ